MTPGGFNIFADVEATFFTQLWNRRGAEEPNSSSTPTCGLMLILTLLTPPHPHEKVSVKALTSLALLHHLMYISLFSYALRLTGGQSENREAQPRPPVVLGKQSRSLWSNVLPGPLP